MGQPVGYVERSVNVTLRLGLPETHEKLTVGTVHADGVGEIDGDGEMLGETDGDGDAEPDGAGEADALGDGVGAGAGTVTTRVVVSDPPWFVTCSVIV
jgi:hypothetical protein